MGEAFNTLRKFGVEIETVGLSRSKIFNILKKAGINCRIESLNHDTRPHWKIVPDGSLTCQVKDTISGLDILEAGVEVVSPILFGTDGLNEVIKVVKALVAGGAKINDTCGLHVHVDARDMSASQIFVAVKRYRIHEDLFDTFVKPSRRGSGSIFAKNMLPVEQQIERDYRFAPVNRFSARLLCDSAEQMGRYRKLNLCSYLRHGTLEFRQHHGSLDANEIINWVMLCVTFIDDSIKMRTNTNWWSKYSIALEYSASGLSFQATRHDFQDYGILANLPDNTREFYQKRSL